MQSDLTQNNVSSRIARATANNDFEALAYINDWITLEDARIPNTISAGYVAQRYASISLSAVADGATQADRDRLDVFRTVELPILINSLRLADRQSQGATTLISAYDNLATLQADPDADPNAIAQAEQRIRTLLNVEASEAIARDSGSPIQLIEKNDDFTFSQVTGYAHPDPQNPGQVIYREGPSADSPIIEGSYTELPDAVDRQARQVVSTLTTDFRSYTETRQQAVGAVRLLGDLGRIVDEDELVLTGTASIVRGLNNAFTEVSAGLAIMDNLFEGQGEDATITLSQVEREMRSRGVLAEGQSLQELADTPANQIVGLSQDARGLAQRKAIFEAKIVLMTFRAGGLEGQSGQAMSNRDFDRLRQMLTGGRTRETFLGTLSSYVNDRVQAVRDQHITITEDPDLRSFIQRHGYDPLNGEPRAYSIDRVFEQNAPNDRRLARGIDYLNYEPELAPARNEVTPGVTELTTMYQSGEPIVITQEFYEANREGLDAQGFAVGDTIQMQGGN